MNISRRNQTSRSSRVTTGAALIAAAAILLTACASPPAAPQDGVELQKVTMYTYAFPTFLVQRVAESEGFYEAEGLDVEFIVSTNGAQVSQLLMAGQGLGAIGAANLPLAGRAAGQDFVVLGSYINQNVYAVYAPEDSGLPFDGTFEEKVAALKGLTVGVTGLGAAVDIVAQSILRAGGLNPDSDVTRVAAGAVDSQIGQLRAGTIDVFVNTAPADAMLKDAGLGAEYISVDEMPDSVLRQASLVAYTSRATYEAHRDQADSWIEAERRATAWLTDEKNFEAVEGIMKEYLLNDVSDSVLRSTTESFVNYYRSASPTLSVPHDAIDNTSDALIDLGVLADPQLPLDYESVVAKDARE